jgi:ketosteroid isomerase-like protein
MKIGLLLILVGSAIGYVVPTLAQQKETPDPQLRQVADALTKKFNEAWDKNDAAALASLFTVDAVLVTDKGPIYGRDAIEKMYMDLFKQVHFSNHIGKPDQYAPHIIGTAGNEMWWNGEWTTTVKGENFGPVEAKGYWTSIVVREGSDWKDRMQIFNVTPASAATPSPTTSPSNQ